MASSRTDRFEASGRREASCYPSDHWAPSDPYLGRDLSLSLSLIYKKKKSFGEEWWGGSDSCCDRMHPWLGIGDPGLNPPLSLSLSLTIIITDLVPQPTSLLSPSKERSKTSRRRRRDRTGQQREIEVGWWCVLASLGRGLPHPDRRKSGDRVSSVVVVSLVSGHRHQRGRIVRHPDRVAVAGHLSACGSSVITWWLLESVDSYHTTFRGGGERNIKNRQAQMFRLTLIWLNLTATHSDSQTIKNWKQPERSQLRNQNNSKIYHQAETDLASLDAWHSLNPYLKNSYTLS